MTNGLRDGAKSVRPHCFWTMSHDTKSCFENRIGRWAHLDSGERHSSRGSELTPIGKQGKKSTISPNSGTKRRIRFSWQGQRRARASFEINPRNSGEETFALFDHNIRGTVALTGQGPSNRPPSNMLDGIEMESKRPTKSARVSDHNNQISKQRDLCELQSHSILWWLRKIWWKRNK